MNERQSLTIALDEARRVREARHREPHECPREDPSSACDFNRYGVGAMHELVLDAARSAEPSTDRRARERDTLAAAVDVEALARALQADDEITPHYCTPVGTPCRYCTAFAERIARHYKPGGSALTAAPHVTLIVKAIDALEQDNDQYGALSYLKGALRLASGDTGEADRRARDRDTLAVALHDAIHEAEPTLACRPGHEAFFRPHAAALAARGITAPESGLREAARRVITDAEPDIAYEGEGFVDYIVPFGAIAALRAALASEHTGEAQR